MPEYWVKKFFVIKTWNVQIWHSTTRITYYYLKVDGFITYGEHMKNATSRIFCAIKQANISQLLLSLSFLKYFYKLGWFMEKKLHSHHLTTGPQTNNFFLLMNNDIVVAKMYWYKKNVPSISSIDLSKGIVKSFFYKNYKKNVFFFHQTLCLYM